jgi:hypothetical protein
MSSVSPFPSNPFHIARAYGVQPPVAPRPTTKPAQIDATGTAGSVKPPTTTTRLAAAVVPGKINFTGSAPTDVSAALPLYRHPADKNAAATAVNAGRLVDLEG